MADTRLDLKRDTLLTTLPELGKEWEVALQIRLTEYDTAEYRSILHMTTGGDNDKYGDRTPTLEMDPRKKLYVESAASGLNYMDDRRDPIPLDTWTEVKVSQTLTSVGKYMFRIFLAGVKVFAVENTKPEVFKDVKVYATNPWKPAQAGSIKGVTIKTRK